MTANITPTKILIKGYDKEELKSIMQEMGEPSFRAEQIFNWIYNHRVEEFDSMLNLSKPLREKLKEKFSLTALSLVDSQISRESETKKFLFRTNESNVIESVIIPEQSRVTLCLSTQVGCPLDCKFCATGLMGYKKNLSAGEIFDQYSLAQKNFERRISNIVYMGMGEPLLNFENTVKSLKIFADEKSTGISLKKITVSTAGIPHKILELAKVVRGVKLAFSLHSCFEDVRSKIMPINKKYSLRENIEAVQRYARETKTRITFEYVMLKGINDREEDIAALAKLCKRIPSKVNVIPFNSLKHMSPEGLSSKLESSSKEHIEHFVDELILNNISVFVRDTRGDDIAAACGQLAVKQK